MPLRGKVALITGGANGIGAATARVFLQAGAKVAIADLLDPDTVAAHWTAADKPAWIARCDVADPQQVEALVSETVTRLGPLDVFVANAAYSKRGPFTELADDEFRRTLEVTMMGAFYGLRAAARTMIAHQTAGAIVVVSSPHARVPVPGAMPYNMAKAAVDSMAQTAATELLPHRIRVNLVHPGWTDTPGERRHFTEEDLQRKGAQLPFGRLAAPEEIARGIAFLAEEESAYITGSTLAIDGGIQLPWRPWT